MQDRAPGVILPIQYLRGIAALMVVWHHAAKQIPSVEKIFSSAFGPSGVDLFFVISGFIMVVTTSRSTAGPWQFMRRRIIRVVPMYWLLTLAMVALALAVPSLFRTLQVAGPTLLQSLLFIPHFSQSFPTYVWPLLVPGWTLNYEMFFYAMFALSLALPRGSRLAALVSVFVSLAALGFVAGPFESAIARTYTDPILLEFVAGAVIGSAWLRGAVKLPLSVAAVFVLVGGTMLVLRNHPPLGVFTQMIGAPLVVLGALTPRASGWQNGWLRALGDSSYSLYLTHLFTLGALRVLWARLLPGESTLDSASVYMLVALTVSAVAGWLAYRYVETPLLARLSGPRRRVAVAA